MSARLSPEAAARATIAVIVGVLLCGCGGMFSPELCTFLGEIAAALGLGWVRFLTTAAPTWQPASGGVAPAGLCLAGVATGIHLGGRW